MSRICVVGVGYVGLVTGACFAELGHHVTCVDNDRAKIDALSQGLLPFYEPGLEPLVRRNQQAHRLHVNTSLEEGAREADFVFLCVGTPTTSDNRPDLSHLRLAYLQIGASVSGERTIIVNKSTVPPGATSKMERLLARLMHGAGVPPVVANPEFSTEGHAVSDFMHPDRVVIGAREQWAARSVAELYAPLHRPIIITDPGTAEMIKYASNAFLATKISFINEIAALCESIGVNIGTVAEGMGLDTRIGKGHLRAGIGYGGSCLPKDIAALIYLVREYGEEARLLSSVQEVNTQQPRRLVRRVKEALGTLIGARVAVLGLTFKPDTDDLRCSPAIELVKMLRSEGARVRSCDPVAWREGLDPIHGVTGGTDPYEAAAGCDAVVLATEWPDFKALDLQRLKDVMRGSVLADGRNALEPAEATAAGFLYLGVGRGVAGFNAREVARPLSGGKLSRSRQVS